MNYKHEATAVAFHLSSLSDGELALHDKAVTHAERYLKHEAELLRIIMDIDRTQLYRKFDLHSTYAYCLQYLNLSEAVTANFINVARKSVQVPQLKLAIEAGQLSVPKARKIVPVINTENCSEWISKAIHQTQALLERDVANACATHNPRALERARPIGGNRTQISFSAPDDVMKLIRRAQDLVSQSSGSNASLEDTITRAIKEFVDKHDPVKIAERNLEPNVSHDIPFGVKKERSAIPVAIKRAVYRRDKGRCQAVRANGKVCGATRFIHFHHKIPVSQGGSTSPENLITLCSQCHRKWHERDD